VRTTGQSLHASGSRHPADRGTGRRCRPRRRTRRRRMKAQPARREVLAGLAATVCLPAFTAKAGAPGAATDPAGLTATLDAIADDMLDASPERVTSLGLDTGRRAQQAGALDGR